MTRPRRGWRRGLMGSAQAFLVESLQNYKDGKLNFAIVNAITATELVLKERLARVNPALVYRNIDAPQLERAHTVGLSSIPHRLSNLGLPLRPAEVRLIGTFAEWRNQIVHHMPSFSDRAARRQLPQLLDTLATLLRRDLGAALESFLPRSLFRVVLGLLNDWRGVVAKAGAAAHAEGAVLQVRCHLCAAEAVVCARKGHRTYCHLCGSRAFYVEECESCERPIIGIVLSRGHDAFWCDECIEDAEAYASGERYGEIRGASLWDPT